jgi:hypothetical protein
MIANDPNLSNCSGPINYLTYTECHCGRLKSDEIATPACRNALPTAGRHFGVQARRFTPRNDNFLSTFTLDLVSFVSFVIISVIRVR